MDKISVVIPCYFNEDNISVTMSALVSNERLFGPGVHFEYVLIDDGSEDGTLSKLKEFKQEYSGEVTILKLVSNVGSYNAIYAGLKYASGDCIVVMAADLQDPPELILEMYKQWSQGTKIVLANRVSASSVLASVLRWILKTTALSNLPEGGFDYCLFDKEVKEQILERMPPNINSLYLLLTLGHKCVSIPYRKRVREIGKSKWTTKKKVILAYNTFRWFASERIPILAYFWRRLPPQFAEPFIIDEVL